MFYTIVFFSRHSFIGKKVKRVLTVNFPPPTVWSSFTPSNQRVNNQTSPPPLDEELSSRTKNIVAITLKCLICLVKTVVYETIINSFPRETMLLFTPLKQCFANVSPTLSLDQFLWLRYQQIRTVLLVGLQ